jgi:hypothetical protein
MKRIREDGLPRDIAAHLHTLLGAVGLLPQTLAAWHATCWLFQRQWCQMDYLLRLLEASLEVSRARFLRAPHVALNLARFLTLDVALMTARLGEAIAVHAVPVVTLIDNLNAKMNSLYTDKCRVQTLVDMLGDERVKLAGSKTTLLPRVEVALKRAVIYVRERHGWCVSFSRDQTRIFALDAAPKKTERHTVDLATENLESTDSLWVTLDPALYA